MSDRTKLLEGFAFNIEASKGRYANMSRLLGNLEKIDESEALQEGKGSFTNALVSYLDKGKKETNVLTDTISKMSTVLEKIDSRLSKVEAK